MALPPPMWAACPALLVLSALAVSSPSRPSIAAPAVGRPSPRSLRLRGGGSAGGAALVVPDQYQELEGALAALLAGDQAAAPEAEVRFRAGNHSIGTVACNKMAVLLDRDDFRLRVRGEPGATLAGAWRCAGGGGEISDVRLLDVALLADANYDGEFLHPGIMYGDCCIAAFGARPWVFRDLEVQCSGTALRAFNDADVTCERMLTGGDSVSTLPPSNIHDMEIAPWLKQILLENMDTRNKTTGLPLYPESSMPRYGVTAWGRARVRLRDCRVVNMTLNGVSASENATLHLSGCEISGSGMAGLYLEGAANVTLSHCHFFDNLACLSVWGGYGDERWLKTVGTNPRDHEEQVSVTPQSSLLAVSNTLHGTVWAGLTRPLHFEEEQNEIVDDVDVAVDEPDEDVPFYMDSAELDNKTQGELWDIYGPISTPKWARGKGRKGFGGDGVVEWGPTEGLVDRDPMVMLDVSMKDPLFRDPAVDWRLNETDDDSVDSDTR